MPDSHLNVIDSTLFNCHTLGQFDVILCLGLVYHFRHPQLVLDYLGNLGSTHLIISTQTYKSDKDVMINRSEITPKWVSPERPLLGWHFSRSLFIKMLTTAGFTNSRSINHSYAQYDVEDNLPKSITNTGYFAADSAVPVDTEAKTEEFM